MLKLFKVLGLSSASVLSFQIVLAADGDRLPETNAPVPSSASTVEIPPLQDDGSGKKKKNKSKSKNKSSSGSCFSSFFSCFGKTNAADDEISASNGGSSIGKEEESNILDQYGPEILDLAKKYGPQAIELAKEYGPQAIDQIKILLGGTEEEKPEKGGKKKPEKSSDKGGKKDKKDKKKK